ncbi:pentapeptide repeat-containing protein [bacterium]|jgi:uncharacterized protein YjbI with pentapeptide repeats|nr:pentapeptide repeat-containing protein [bacterium]MBT5015455.1 pentapeptide repeat-containing protein [bacterium]
MKKILFILFFLLISEYVYGAVKIETPEAKLQLQAAPVNKILLDPAQPCADLQAQLKPCPTDTPLGTQDACRLVKPQLVCSKKGGMSDPKKAARWKKDFTKLLNTGECPGCFLDGIDLQNIQLKPKANFKGASLRFADLRGMVMTDGDFSGANFDYSLMNGCSMGGVKCNNTSFVGTALNNVYAANSEFKKANFTDANLSRMLFYDESPGKYTKNSDLQGAIFKNTAIQFAMFSLTNMANVKGISVRLSAQGFPELIYTPALFQESTNNWPSAVFCATLLPIQGRPGKNIVVSLKDSFAGGSWCNCSFGKDYKFTVTSKGGSKKVFKDDPFVRSGVKPKHATDMGCQ